ncbi:hypothetical protein JQ561_11445 [Bradyrhizobium diazoefficiens]|uniref:hypothetical protein n=1 Tax=Bradyrhizobium sp. WYCCWR 12699 TaxID=3064203 RepID=UPI001BA7D300|nr:MULTISPECIES: hypothetical protein [Bradyrhizobium]MBR0927217.1 hypothetical protein [Bradyrhizobium diazoefficiens]MDT4741460.1 hypothetical protein [Bradyrhizobium sp. WYCCWR 12699]
MNRSIPPIACTGKVAMTAMARLRAVILVVQSCRSRFVRIGHCSQPSCGFTMGEIVRDAATALGVVEQGALLDVHLVTTRKLLDGLRNDAPATPGKTGKIFVQTGNAARERAFRSKELRDKGHVRRLPMGDRDARDCFHGRAADHGSMVHPVPIAA